ncbi:multiheme c-type cytochrome [Sphingomonas adhaesiva]|uniref:multiheme c-type cytochrome n=1 Tax=Sphingomonas adhaesiva TaxID=28212 RepID=UPI002FF80174
MVGFGRIALWVTTIALAVTLVLGAFHQRAVAGPAVPAGAASPEDARHLGVGSCAGSTCHGRQEATGAVVRQDELMRWQDPASPAGAHSRAWTVLNAPRGRAIAARLGIGDPGSSASCIGCHADPMAGTSPGVRLADGVGCEACHGGAAGWIASHAAVGGTHADNVRRGMVALDDPRTRASRCLDCHFGSDRPGQFVDHRIMAAGHPRISFELDLFSTIQQHWNEDADYARRKRRPSAVRTWAVGQAAALTRALATFSGPRGTAGAFPEFYFFDCHSCHRRISDDAGYRPAAVSNPGRPVPPGTPPFQDENIIMLSAAAQVVAPAAGARFDRDSRAFHAALTQGRPQALAAARTLWGSADALSAAFAAHAFGASETLAIVGAVANGAAARYTDYEASVQAVMAVDTLLSALVHDGTVSADAAAGIRAEVNRAYAATRDPNAYRPLEFRAAIARAGAAIRRLG